MIADAAPATGTVAVGFGECTVPLLVNHLATLAFRPELVEGLPYSANLTAGFDKNASDRGFVARIHAMCWAW